jgi:hypothetical protein
MMFSRGKEAAMLACRNSGVKCDATKCGKLANSMTGAAFEAKMPEEARG